MRIFAIQSIVLASAALLQPVPVAAQGNGPGVTPTEVKLGQTGPYSGPVSAYGMFGKANVAYFEKVNASGGVNGRKVKLVSLDDGYAPPKTVEQTRKLVEQERVLALFGSIGTAHNVAIKGYLAERSVPMLFAGIGANIWGAPDQFKMSTMWSPDHRTESATYARHILKTRPNAKIAILMQNDDFGRNMAAGFKDALGDKRSMIVAEATFETTDPTVDSQIASLKNSGADTFLNFAPPRSASQAIRRAGELGWTPAQYVFSFAASIDGVLKPAGVDKSTGVMTATYMKDPTSPAWKDDAGVKDYLAWLKQYLPEGSPTDPLVLQGYSSAELMTHILRQAGADLNRDTLVKQTKSVKDLQLSMLLPGIRIDTTRPDPSGIHELRLQRFDGTRWQLMD
jgi:branched-chain amino acid transport system substrate-binding protein